ncbi:tetratricopeptide repeat protein [Aerolutibacter ruishenii]|uniref:Flp pilus assembly protein TadD n=1 Tax=Aerolutibacter ruishenii TaxID=686800 RepID=A0A562M0N4_9GAMM|nr:tetratricopeptide repeat protein [Lysobacter ruishenii]TWI13507.1 Flp pilus assembly protein TadD [Lysobacter ruishenii]
MYETILQALRSGDAAAGVAAARDAVAANPQDATAHRLLATALRTAGERDAALAAIGRAIELSPDDAGLHLAHAGLLLEERQLGEAEAALARTIGLDPNQFPAYIVQGQLAIARGDLDEAERVARVAARIAPEHPHVATIVGTVALRRGDADGALATLARAAERAPGDEQVRHALGLAYMAKGHLAFAEQAFRSLLELRPDSRPLRLLVADLANQQGRKAEAADMLAPLLDAGATPALLRTLGMLEYDGGRVERARELLRQAFDAAPTDRATLAPLVEVWRREDLADEARTALDAALGAHPAETALWHARLVFEPFAGDEARAVVERWQQAMPDTLPPLMAQWAIEDASGALEKADAIALRITELEPGHTAAEMRVIDALLRTDPDAAIARVDMLITRASDAGVKRALRQLLGRAYDAAGQHEAAVATWAEVHAEVADQRLPYPPLSTARSDWPELAPLPDDAKGVLLLWGAPGSLVERIAATFETSGAPLRADRLGANPPNDFLQRYPTIEQLSAGDAETRAEALVDEWRSLLPTRGIEDGNVFDWLLWWDNALLAALRPHLPEAVLMVALRDPRDMLLDWLAFGAPVPFQLESPDAGARWLAQVLAQVAYLHEQDLFPHRLVRLDDIAQDPKGIAQALANALETQVRIPPQGVLQPERFAAGHWRAYSGALAEAFTLLTPVAKRLGYPE